MITIRTLAKLTSIKVFKLIEIPQNLSKNLDQFFKKLIKNNEPNTFGNGREARNLFENMLIEQSARLDLDDINLESINTFNKEDLKISSKKYYNINLNKSIIDYVVTNFL